MSKVLSILTTILLSLSPAVAGSAAVPTPDKLLPSDTLAVLTVPNWTATRKSSAPALQLWDDPAMKPFKDKFLTKWKSDFVEPFQREFGIKFTDYTGLAQGQVTLAITQSDAEDDPNDFLLLIDNGDKAEVMKTNLASLKKSWVDKGKQIRSEKIRDVEFTTFIFQSDEFSKTLDEIFPDPQEGFEKLEEPKPKKPAKRVEWLVGQSGTLFILGDDPKQIEKVLARMGGGNVPGLAEQASFATHYGPLFRNADAYGWVNLKAFVDILGKKTKETEGDKKRGGFDFGAMLKGLGLHAVQSFAFSLQNSPEGYTGNVVINVPESGRQGLFKVFAFPQKEAVPPPLVPADATKFMRWRLDMPQAWASLEKMLAEVHPMMAGAMKLVIDTAGKDKDPNFDLRKNLIENLGDDIISYSKPPRSQTLADLQSAPSVTLIGSPRPEPLAASLKALASPLLPPQSKMKEREFLGRKVYTVNLPAQRGAQGAAKADRSISFAATGGYVAISTDTPMLEEFLRGNQEKSLRDFSGLAAAADKVGGMGTGLFGFENQKETSRHAFETLRKESGTLANLLAGTPLAGRLGAGEEQSKFKEWVDFSLLPPFDKIAKYFHFSVWSGQVKADGIHFKVFNPTPPGLK
jgi:hypothetical protein